MARARLGPLLVLGALAGSGAACSDRVLAPLDRLDQPTGMALSPRGGWLLVSNGDWDQSREDSSIVLLDLGALDEALDDPREAGASLSGARPCRRRADDGRIECDPELLIDAEAGLRVPAGAGNLLTDRYDASLGSGRVLVPSRLDPAVTWFDLREAAGGPLELACERDLDARCASDFELRGLAGNPANIGASADGRYAFLPHLIQRSAGECEQDDDPRCAGMTLIDLRAAVGPSVVDVAHDFFRTDPLFDSGLAGGFSVTELPCDLAAPPGVTRGCSRPLMYAGQRHWWGLRMFTVIPETAFLSGFGTTMLFPNNLDGARPLPLNADLAFEDPEHLLMVHTTPPALSRIDTSLDEDGNPLNLISRTVSLCSNPNQLELYPAPGDPAAPPRFAFVSCYGDGRVSVVALPELTPFRTIYLGEGSNELLVDPDRQWLFVANVIENSISIVELDPSDPDYLREFATLGLGTERGTE